MHYFVTDRMHPCSFFAEAQRIVTEDYVPSLEDIRHVSEKRIMKTHFNFGQLTIRVLQIHNQQSYSRKWIHVFEGVTSLMFCVSLLGYDERSGVGQVCVCRFVLLPTICVTTSRRRDWLNRLPFSDQLSTRAGSCDHRSYYS